MGIDPNSELGRKCLALAGLAEPVKPLQTVFSCVLPLPPSTNNLFASVGKRRVKSKAYRDWITEAIQSVEEVFSVATPVSITLTLTGQVNEQRDLANIEKASVDLLVAWDVIPDDSLKFVHSINLRYLPSDSSPCVQVEVRTIDNA